ncbi:hypothetical protein HYH03_005503 [Edaphochlamys debaryana]|uniref:Fibrocystin-L n=1 Tax=Edaphochlamys debaryana TaxID=47281 RepID=A0A836C113_9CHLO|nr:hypothetical protein HYH03_005503 [Edaphochlamys debaryana]|eukprot:KAG2496270.1 hypothetical protein HYH03_005503 [Edaphochlamys debaryana]
MLHSTFVRAALAAACILALLPSRGLAQPYIDSIQPRYGSLAGGTRLSIYGSGFGDMMSGMPLVFVGSYPCVVVGHLSASESITCLTSKGEAGSYVVSVIVGNFEPVTISSFIYSDSYSPTLRAIYPSAGPPGTIAYLMGKPTWSISQDCKPENWGEVSCVSAIMFGDWLCRQDVDNEDTILQFSPFPDWNRYYNGWTGMYRVGCSVAAPRPGEDQPAIGTAGSFNASLHFEGSLRGGLPTPEALSYQYDVNGIPYQFQLYPEVTSVSPAAGSTAGGNTLTLRGRGFPDLSLERPGDRVEVKVGGAPCVVVSSEFDKVTCVTEPRPDAGINYDATPIKGLYPAGRGVEYEFYNLTDSSPFMNKWSDTFRNLWRINNTYKLTDVRNGSYAEILTGGWDSPNYAEKWHCSAMKAFFTAPLPGDYRFYMAADDYGQLNATWLENGVEVSRTIVNMTTWAATDDFFKYDTQASAPITLAEGQSVLLQSSHCNTYSIGHQQVAVRVPVPEPRLNSMAEEQRITITTQSTQRMLYIKYLYGAGVGTSIKRFELSTIVDASLDNDALGIKIEFDSVTVVVPATATAADMTAMVEEAFGGKGSLGSNRAQFGVRKERKQGSLVIEFGINSTLGDSIDFDGMTVELDTIRPKAYTYVADDSTCTYSNEYNRPDPSAGVPPPPPMDDATLGVVLLEVPRFEVPRVVPGGNIELYTGASETPITLPYDADASMVRAALRNLTNYDATVLANSTVREGAYFARIWNITFPNYASSSIPPITARIEPNSAPDGVLVTTEVRPASDGLSGKFMVSFAGYCEAVAMEPGFNAEQISAALSRLPKLGSPLRVDIDGSLASSVTFTITFDPFKNPGDVPSLRVVDIRALGGVKPNASVSTIRDGSIDAFYAPIPTEFLRLATATPNTIKASANLAPFACADPTGACPYVYDDALTPIVTAISPRALSFADATELPLTITGTGFTLANSAFANVTVGNATCRVTSFTDTQIICMVSENAPAGSREVKVNVQNVGFAKGFFTVVLETLFVTGVVPSPAVVSASGQSVLKFTGKGFDPVNCSSNVILIDNVPCVSIACTTRSLTVLYPGNGGTERLGASVVARVYEKGKMIDEDAPASPTVDVSLTGSAITAVAPDQLPGSGGNITLSLANTAAGTVTAVYLLPRLTDLANYTAVNAAFKARVPCENVTGSGAAAVTCAAGPLPNGQYQVLAELSSGLQLLCSDTVLYDLLIESVSPGSGSIGGGTTVVIRGSGFSPIAADNLVYIRVPISSVFLNGIVMCNTVSANATTIVCRTRPHLAAEADVDDPFAKKVMPVPTLARSVRVVICNTTYYNTSKLRDYCSDLAETPRARCTGTGPNPCSFAYVTELTPAIGGVVPTRGYGGQSVTIVGSFLGGVAHAYLTQNGVTMGECLDVQASGGAVTCTLPDLPSGVYNFLLKKANGELSVDALNSGVFTYYTTITALANNAGSLAGGLPLTLTAGGAGFALGGPNTTTNTTANMVTIAGLPCPVLTADLYKLTCRSPPINGYVFAEYWNLGVSAYSMPSNLISWTRPHASRLEKGINFNWGSGSPITGTIASDFFVVRFTFYMQVSSAQSVTYYLESDDDSQLYVDDALIGTRWRDLPVDLTPGVHKFVITYAEYGGSAYVRFKVNGATPDWSKVTPVPPGSALPVEININGVTAESHCPESNITLLVPGWAPDAAEPTWQTTDENVCSFVYSTYRTPTLVPVGTATNGITPFQPNGANIPITITGKFPYDTSKPAAPQFAITILDLPCPVTEIASDVASNVTTVTCMGPAVPTGLWPVNILVQGLGFARPVLGASTGDTDLPTINYPLLVDSINGAKATTAVAGTPVCQMSIYGGGTAVLMGYGFVKDGMDVVTNRTFTVLFDTLGNAGACNTRSAGSPLCLGARDVPLSPELLACDGPTATIRVPRFVGSSDPATVAGVASVVASLKLKPRVYLPPGVLLRGNNYSEVSSFPLLVACGTYTPKLFDLSMTSTAPVTNGASLDLSWSLAANMSNIPVGPVNGNSTATVQFEVAGGRVLTCKNPKVLSSVPGASSYSETLRCELPAHMPAATYTMWVCVQPVGCGAFQRFTVPLTVTSLSVDRGSSAGGMTVVIRGSGFDLDPTYPTVRFGNYTCDVQDVDTTSLTCITGSLPSKPVTTEALPLSVVPTKGAPLALFDNLQFVYDPTLESAAFVSKPNRGSTEGGTKIEITGADFSANAETKVIIGGTQCVNVTVISSTAIRCTTGKPPRNIMRVPLPVVVWQSGRGYSRSNASYQYIDLWSRNSTWGGGPLPGDGDWVRIPEGITVLLDISPPPLDMVVLEGNLVFDDTADYINLQTRYILVMGGNLTIGTAEKPYPGRANITMLGGPNSRDLPMYGGKAIGVREGVVTLYGKPKIPHYTNLNQTVRKGGNSITINGDVNWEVGDTIVIATSSWNGTEADEAVVTAIDKVSVPGCVVLSLDRAMLYDHVGAIHTQPGAADLDMRAEVAVLTRNVLFTGDWQSRKYMYGATLMVNSPRNMPRALIRFDNVEVTQSGQAFRLGRYSLHWHMHGDVNYQSWVRGCAIHHTYNRAITIHGTHRAIIQNVTAYRTMGHTFFLEDGIESGNLIENNIGIDVRASDALLNTDTTPAVFWITNPNNTVRNNVAAGSAAYGYWYRMLDNPEGPSYTTKVCPKFMQMLEFSNNTAHGNMFYGLRIHPEYYPRNSPCNGFSSWQPFEQTPAVFNGLRSYKNGMKGVICTQCGLVQWTNMVLGDNGGGPRAHIVNGKDHGGDAEMSWVVDDRNRFFVETDQMAGITNMTIYARTSTGNVGTAGQWPSGRRVAGIITQSPVLGDPKHSALMAITNVTFVDFSATAPLVGPEYSALEACGKCKTFQGGATTFTSGLKFITTDGSPTKLSTWSWGHQGVFQDMDGSLINADTIPASLQPNNWALGPGTTWHSAVESELFDPNECVYLRPETNADADPITNDGAICSPALTFRRIMLNGHGPEFIKFKDLKLTSLATNRTSLVHFTKYNEEGYQFTVPTGRDYWVHWDMPFRVDPEEFQLHKMDLMKPEHHVFISSKYVQAKDHFTVNNRQSNLTEPPTNTSDHGAFSYDKKFTPNTWWWGNYTYNDTCFKVVTAGTQDYRLSVESYTCPDEGCNNLPTEVVDVRNETLLWSNAATWTVASVGHPGKPVKGDNVTIPYGWELIIDENPPELEVLVIQGNVRFSTDVDVTLLAKYVIVMSRGALRAGAAGSPHPRRITIGLVGGRQTPDYGIDNKLNLGSKVLAAIRGGTIDLYGRQISQRWTRLTAPAKTGDSTLTVAGDVRQLGWQVGNRILVTSTTFNWKQSEIRNVTAITTNGATSTLTLDSALTYTHDARFKSYTGGPAGGVDMRAEVAMLSSSILITAANGASSYTFGSEMFGARVVVSGNSTGRFDGITMEYCGQGGLTDRACIFFDRLTSLTVTADSANGTGTGQTGTFRNPSVLRSSALVWGMNSNVRIGGTAGVNDGVAVVENVMYEAYDISSIDVDTSGNVIRGNLALGTIKDMTGKSGFDLSMPCTFDIKSASNWVEDNVAAGSERFGFAYYGLPCASGFATGSFRNNTAHTGLDGMWLRASNESIPTGCTALRNFTTWMNWDFGIISMRGIPTDVLFEDVNVLDTKHVGVQVLRVGGFTEEASAEWKRGLIVGQSGSAFCDACPTLSAAGCHPKLSRQSYNKATPFTPAVGIQSAMFALAYTPGPEKKPYDKPMGYATVHGRFDFSGLTMADFAGANGCGGVGSYALANHPEAPEAFYPHEFTRTNVINVASGAKQGMFLHSPPSPDWRNEADCGEAVLPLDDGTELELNCAGPAHALWRDLDGSMIGSKGSVAGIFTQPRHFAIDQGSPVIPGACSYSSAYDSYNCYEGSSSFLLDPALKPSPIPKKGIWGDPQHFVLESRDADSEDRNFGPVFFNVSGSIDAVSAAMDHGWCFAYTCQKRLSTFWTYLPTGQTVYVTFRGSPSQVFRLWLPYADPDAEIILVINYLGTLQRRFVYLTEAVDGVTGRVVPLDAPPSIGDESPHGSFFWDQNSQNIHVKIKGGRSMEIRTENSIYVTQSFAVTVDEFYTKSPEFMKDLSNAMGFKMERLFTAKIVPGSAVLTTGMGPQWINTFPIAEPVVLPGVDPSDPVDPMSALPSSATTRASKSNKDAADQSLIADLVAGAIAYNKVVSDPNVMDLIGLDPLGPPTFDLAGLSVTDPSIAAAITSALAAEGITVIDSLALSPPPSSAPSGNPGSGAGPTVTDSPSPPPSPTPPSPLPPSSPGVAVPNSGTGTTTTQGGSTTDPTAPAPAPADSPSSGSSTPILGIVIGVVVGCVVAALLVLAVVVVKRRRDAKRKREEEEAAAGGGMEGQTPVNPIAADEGVAALPAAAMVADLGMRRGGSHASGSSSIREAFGTTNPAYELPSERHARQSGKGLDDIEDSPAAGPRPGSGRNSPRVVPVIDASGTTPRASVTGQAPLPPRAEPGRLGGQEARESMYASVANRPLVTGHKLPHSNMPLAGGAVPISALRSSTAGSMGSDSANRPKSPAELHPANRASAPGAGSATGPHPLGAVPTDNQEGWWDPEAVQRSAASLGGPMAAAATVTSSPGPVSGRRSGLAPLPAGETSRQSRLPPVEAAKEYAEPEPPVPNVPTEPGGDPNAVTRALVPQESFVPRSRAASRIDDAAVDLAAPSRQMTAAEQRAHADSGDERAAGSPSSRPATATPPAERPPDARALQLPGGMVEFTASPSLLRSEVAAMIREAGPQGMAAMQAAVEAAEREEREAAAGGGAARSPAGLHSDSMRRREQ